MAWNVVIAGGGFGGAAAARELEKVMPKQSARLALVNETNFALYTPFLPEAAAGTLEPRHVVTPLREILKRTYLRLGSIVGHDPEAKTVTLRAKYGETETAALRPAAALARLGLAGAAGARAWPSTRSGSRASPTRSTCATTWSRRWRKPTRPRTRRGATELLTYVFVGGGYAGLEALAELQDFAADAMESYPRARLHGMRWVLVEATDRVLPEIDQRARPSTRCASCAAAASTSAWRRRWRRSPPNSARLSSGEVLPTRTVVWTAGVAPQPILEELNVPLDERGRVPVDSYLRVQGMDSVWAIGDCAAAPDPSGGTSPADRPARGAAGPGGRAQHRRRARHRHARAPSSTAAEAAFVNLGRYKAVGRIGDRTFRGFPAWWLARTYHMSQIPGTARKVRAVLDWTAGLPFRRDISEVGTIGHPKPLDQIESARKSASDADADSSYPRGGWSPSLFLVFGEGAPEAVFARRQVEAARRCAAARPFRGSAAASPLSPRAQVEVVRVFALVVEFDGHLAGFDAGPGEGEVVLGAP